MPRSSSDPHAELFYDSLCLPRTHPNHLAALGRVMGLAAPLPARCRALELGCASGGNLIPMAYRLPGATFVGVDLSAAQIGAGQDLIDRLRLTNIELRAADIADLKPEALGQFDYVVAHGVYSWVPEAVRLRILPLLRGCLAPNGIGYVSFNTLPGWRMRGMLRDVLRDAARAARGAGAQVEAARLALARLETGLDGLGGAAAEHLRAEIENLRGLPDSYLLFEYLAEHNTALLFRDFLASCEQAGLRYLSDAEPMRNFPLSYGDGVEQALADLEDGVDVEQWLDFLANRNFREALLIRSDADCDEQIDLGRFAGLSFNADLLLDGAEGRPAEVDAAPVRFVRPDGGDEVEVRHPLAAGLVAAIARQFPNTVPLSDLVGDALAQFNPSDPGLAGANAEAFEVAVQELFGLFARGHLRAAPEPLWVEAGIPERPRACALARLQASHGDTQIATITHGNLGVDSIARRLLEVLEGTHDLSGLIKALLEPRSGLPTRPSGREQAERQVRRLVGLFRRYGLLAEPS